MMKFIYMMVMCLGLVAGTSSLSLARVDQPITISNDDLVNMSPDARNILLAEIKKKTDDANNNKVLSTVMGDMDVATFTGKAEAIANAIILFCDKLGVKVNEFIYTPAGTMVVLGVIYKLGVFGSLWVLLKGSFIISIFSYILFAVNTKAKKTLNVYDKDGHVIKTTEELLPRFNAIMNNNSTDTTIYSVVASCVCVVVMLVTFLNM